MEELKEELLNILPNGSKVDNQTILDLPQFLKVYLYKLRDEAVQLYPGRKELIEDRYDFIISDLNNPFITRISDE